MKLNTQPAPHIRHHESARTLMGDAVLVLLILYAMAYYYYGPRAVALGAWSVLISVLADTLCTLLRRRAPNRRDLSPIVTGLLLPLMMPAIVPYKVVAIAAIFAIVVAKQPFGGVGHNVFNPAAAGFSFVAICFGADMFTYPVALQRLPVFGAADYMLGISPAFTLELGGVPKISLVDMALGNMPGPMGATNILVILACLLYLVFRGTVRWGTPLAFFLTVGAIAYLFPRAGTETRMLSVALELMSGMLLLGGVFFLGDPVTTPKRNLSKTAFGIMAGVMVMLFRRFGSLEEGMSFAVLLMNATVWMFDMAFERLYSIMRRRRGEAKDSKALPEKA